jgi:TolB-like protein
MKINRLHKSLPCELTPGWMIIFVLLAIVGIFLNGCTSSEAVGKNSYSMSGLLPHAAIQNQPGGSLLLKANTEAGDALAAQLLGRVGSTSGILSASLVKLNNLDKTSLFGQTCVQQIGSRLSQHGFKPLESRLSAALRFQKTEGEFMLTRDSANLLATQHDAHAVLLGTYSETANRVFISARVVRINDNAVIAAYEYYLPKQSDISVLLGSGTGPANNNEYIWSEYSTREKAFFGVE